MSASESPLPTSRILPLAGSRRACSVAAGCGVLGPLVKTRCPCKRHLYTPSACISVCCRVYVPVSIESVLPQTSSSTHVGNFTHQLLSIDENKCQPAVYGVQLKPEQIMCVSCVHPSVGQAWCLSQQLGDSTVLPEQKCLLNKQKTNLIFLAPSMQVKVLFCSPPSMQTEDTSCTNATANKMGKWNSTVGNDVKTHMFTASLPLKNVLQHLMHSDSIVHEVITSEDDNKVWQMHMSIADKTPPTAKRGTNISACS